MFLTSVRTRGNFSPARNVRSTTAPESRFLTFVRMKAPPLPGFTCWNSTMRQTPPSSSMCIPFRNWLVLTTSAIGAGRLADGDELFREAEQDLGAVVGDDDQVLDPDAAPPLEVDARLDRDHVALRERVGRRLRQPRRLVDVDADAVPEPVAEVVAEAGFRDHVARGRVGARAVDARARRLQPAQLRLEADVVGALQLAGQRAGRERPRAVGA